MKTTLRLRGCLTVLAMFFLHTFLTAQVTGDFRTSGLNTSWNNIAAWERYNGTAWVAATTGQTPGASGQGGNTLIRDGHTITHNIAIVTSLASLTVGEGTSGSLTLGGFNFSVAGTTTVAAGATVTNSNATGTRTFTGDMTINGTFNTTVASAMTFSGNFTNNGVWSNTGNGTVALAGNLAHNGTTFTSGTGVHTLSGATKTISGTASSLSINSVTISGSYTNNVTTLTVATALSGAGTLTMGANTTLNITGTSGITTLNCTTNTPNEVVYNNTVAQTVKGTTYYNLTKAGTAASTSAAAITVNNNLNVNSGTFTMSSTFSLAVTGTTNVSLGATFTSSSTGTHTFTGDFSNYGTCTKTGSGVATLNGNLLNNGTFTSTAGTYTFAGATKTINTTNASSISIANATVSGTYEVTSNYTSTNVFNVTGTLTVSLATSVLTNNGFVTAATLTLTNAASSYQNNNTTTVTTTFSGSATATFTNNANSTLFIGAATVVPLIGATAVPNTVDYNRTNTQTIRGGITYHNLTVSGSNTKTLGAAITVNGDIVVTGTATLADGAFQITGDASKTLTVGSGCGYYTTRTSVSWFPVNIPIGSITLDNNSTVTYAAAATLTTDIPATYGHLVFFGATTKTLPSSYPITVNSSFTISGGTFNDAGNTVTVLGSIASTGTHNGTGKILLTSGSATHNIQGSGWNIVELDDAQGATLSAAFTLGTQTTGSFILTNGVVTMGNFSFTINNVNSIGLQGSGFSSTKMFLQSGTGNFIRNIANSGLPITYEFPIGENTGTTEYSPVTYTVSANATISTIAFRVTDAQHPNDINTTNFVSRYWTAVGAPSSFTYTASFGYPAADITGTESSFDVYLHDPTGLTWELIPATSGSGLATYDGSDGTFSSGNVFMVKSAINIPSTVTIDGTGGTSSTFASLTGTTGFFNAVNQGVITSNVTVNISAASITETGAISLFQATETGAGAGTYTITIQSSDASQKILTSTYSIATVGLQGTIRLNGADRVTFHGGTGTDRRLLLRNTDTGVNGIVVHLFNDATNNQINNCVIEGSHTSTTVGLVNIGTSTISGTGNDNNTFTNNDFKQAGANTPAIGIASNGFSASVTNDNNEISNNNFVNIYRTSSTVAAIYLVANTGATLIDANRIYNDTPRSGAITTNMYGIYVNGTSNSNIDITNNIIGYATSSGTGTMSIVSTGAVRFNAISVLASSNGTCNITGNIIDNITLTSTSGGAANFPLFAGVYAQTTGYLIDDNQIGGLSGSPSIVLSSTTATTLANAVCGISVNSTATTQTISNNKIGCMSFTLPSGTLTMNMNGIKAIAGSVTISGNEIGNATANSFLLTVPGTSAAVNYGIYTTSTASNVMNIQNNIIKNLSAYGAGTASQAVGIFSGGAAQYNIDDNDISFIRTTSTGVSTAGSAAVIGINLGASTTTANYIRRNTIYALTDSSAVNGVVNGIVLVGGSAIYDVSRNNIYNLRSGTGTASVVNGIHISTAQVTVHNNMIRLGYDAYGSSIANTSVISGILKDNGSTNNSYYYNTVYIGGTGVSTTASNTYAFRRAVTGANDNVRNNIFVNTRSNATTGGKHYAFYTANSTTLTSDYNIFYVSGTGTVLAFNGTADQSTMQAWKANTTFDDNSISANPQFIAPTSVTPNLKLNTALNSPAESAAIAISGVTDDIDVAGIRTGYPLGGQTNGGGTAPDIGADESDMIPMDLLPPSITVGAIAPINAACGSTQTIQITATITDIASGVASGGLSPRLWWRLSTAPSYTSVAPTSVVGNLYTYDVTISGIAALQTYHYYIAAQDQATTPNIGYSHFDATSPVHSDVATNPSTLNGAPGTFTILGTVPLSGTVNVGTGQTYTSLNANGVTGLFYALQTNGLQGNLTVNITSDLNESGLYYPLTSIPEFCGSNYTITIQPSSASVKTIYQTSGGNPLIHFSGATNLIIDGSFGGSGKYLTFASRQNTPTVYFNGNCENIQIKNCTIEGNNTLTSGVGPGVINFAGLLGTGTEIRDILIDNNTIRNRSDLTQNATNTPISLINAGGVLGMFNGTNAPLKSNITISNNEMFNFRQSAIAFSQNISGMGIGDSIVIDGNKIYNPITQAQYQYIVYLEGGANSIGHTISNNLIGGSSAPSPNIAGTWVNNLTDGEIWAIYVNSGGTVNGEETVIHNNKISNFNVSGTGYSNFLGIRVEYGKTDITNNLIGSLSASLTTPNIICAGSGDVFDISANSAVFGIWTQSTDEILIDSNTVCGLSATGSFSFMDGIAHGSNVYFNYLTYQTPGGKATITNNNVMYNRCASSLQSLVVSPEAFMGIFCWTNDTTNVIANNKVYNCGSGTTLYNSNVRIHGMFVGVNNSTTTHGGIVDSNEISYLFNENPGDNTNSTSRNPIIYGLTIANGDWTVSNNTIYLNNGTLGGTLITNTNTSIRALNDNLLYDQANCAARYYHNTVLVDGSNTTGAGTANSTYAFLRFPLDFALISITAGAPIELRNNIFINIRGGQGNHRAIGNIANNNSNASINWTSTTSDYNLLSGPSLTNIALWGSSTTYTLANWQSLSSNCDLNSNAILSTTGTSDATHINPSELFVNLTSGTQADLRIETSPPNPPYPYSFVDAMGTPVTDVTTDIDGTTRSASTPTLGAFEMNPCATPTITVGAISTACFSTSSQNVTLAYSGATNSPDEYSITWGTAATTAGFSNLTWASLPSSPITITIPASAAANSYTGTLVVRNSSTSCVSPSYNITVIVNAAPTITLGSNPSVCFSASSQNASLTYSATAGSPNQYSIGSWSGGGFSNVTNAALPASPITISVPAGLTAGVYTAVLTVTNSTTGCVSGTYNISVTVNEAPAITAYSPGPLAANFINNICAGTNTSFGVTATGSGLNYTWQVSTNGGTSWSTSGLGSAPYSGATTATLSINNAPSGLNGNLYRVIVSGACNPADTSEVGTLNVGFANINTQPATSTVVCENGNTSIIVAATGNNLTYSWEISTNGGSSWSALSNSAIYSGVSNDTLTITGALFSMNTYRYRVIVGTTACTPSTSGVSILTVNQLPAAAGTITGTNTVCQGATGITYSVGAIANATGYVWTLPSGASITSGSNTNSITVSFSGSASSGNVNVYGTNSCGSGTVSSDYAVTVNSAVVPSASISSDLGDVICEGAMVTFTASPTHGGTTPVYQWKLNGANVGSNSTTYAVDTLDTSDEVWCVMTSNALCATPSTANSDTITVSVLNQVIPSVSISSDAGVICNGATVVFTATPQYGGTAPSYQWKLNGSDVGTNSNTYTNNSLSNGDLIQVVMTSNQLCANPTIASSNTINATVIGYVTPSVSIVVSPSYTECAGNLVTFTATPVNGGGAPQYQWKVNGINAGSNSDTFDTSDLEDGDVVSVVLTSSEPCLTTTTATSNNITMTIVAAPVADAGIAMSTCGLSPYVFANGAAVSNSPSYSWSENGAGSITAGNGTLTPTYTPASGDLGQTITFTLIATGNGNCEEDVDNVTLFIQDFTSYYIDADGDGFGDPSSTPVLSCTAVAGRVPNNTDCCDTNADINPACEWWADQDGDGYGSYIYTTGCISGCTIPAQLFPWYPPAHGGQPYVADCNDFTITAYPGSTEVCANSIDDDCDGSTDEGCSGIPNDIWGNAQVVNVTSTNAIYPNCQWVNGTLFNADISAQGNPVNVAPGGGRDVWYKFLAPSTGVQIKVAPNAFNAVIELQNSSGSQLDVENVNATVGGGEILNYGTLTVGQWYWVGIRNFDATSGGSFTVCISPLMPSGCATVVPMDGLSLCNSYKATYRGAATYTFNFTGTGGGAPAVTTSATSTGLIALTTPALAVRYGGIYNVRVDANYVLQNGIGQTEPTITVLGSVASSNCTNVRMMDQPYVEVKSTQRCPAVVPRTTYLIGSPVPGNASICGAVSYTYEFQQYSDCAGSSVGMPFTVNTTTNTPYLSLISAFPSPTYPMASNGTWRVRIRPNFVYGNGNYGPYQMVIVSATATASAMAPEDEMLDSEKSTESAIQASIYPNPNDGVAIQLIIQTPFETNVQLRILDAVGRETEKRIITVNQMIQYPFVFNRALESGVYFVEICYGDQVFTEKFVVNP